MSIQSNTRLYHLDAVRSFALLLGIAFHTALSFMPIFIGWAVMDISTSDVLPYFVLVSHSFRMALFFMIAGYFSHMTLRKRGTRPFIQSRLMRVGVPFLVAWFVLRPLLVSGWIMGAEAMRGDANIENALVNGFASLGELPQGLLIGTHLWFLYYLLIISACVVAFRFLIGLHKPTKYRLTQFTDNLIQRISSPPWFLIIMAIPTAMGLCFMQNWGLDTPDKSLIPHIPTLLVYGGFFMFGWLLERKSTNIDAFARISFVKICLCIVSIAGTIYLEGFQGNFGHPQFQLLKAGFMLSYALMMWTLISLSIGLCKKCLHKPNKLVQYISDASYWLYLVHLPIVIWLQVAFSELPYHWSVKFLSIFIITLGISLVIYDLAVRSTFIGAVLNGKRKSRVLFARSKA